MDDYWTIHLILFIKSVDNILTIIKVLCNYNTIWGYKCHLLSLEIFVYFVAEYLLEIKES